jgi:hypothetical protein
MDTISTQFEKIARKISGFYLIFWGMFVLAFAAGFFTVENKNPKSFILIILSLWLFIPIQIINTYKKRSPPPTSNTGPAPIAAFILLWISLLAVITIIFTYKIYS